MIYFLVLLDILINNLTKYNSYFFIIYLYNKSYKHYLLTALILDFVVFETYFYNILILSTIYFCNKIFKELNKQNIYNYIYVCLFNYILYIFLGNILMNNNIHNILVIIGNNLFINIIFYILSNRLYKRKN